MVYFSGLLSIIESIYLNEPLKDTVGSCKIFINPENIHYLTGKIIIINELNYPKERIEVLIKNNCKIISRVNIKNNSIEFQPYILRLCLNVVWNGITLDLSNTDTDKFLERILDNCSYITEDNILLFPKLVGDDRLSSLIFDENNNLTSIGWAQQQVGINLKKDTSFIDLDIVKTKKVNFNQ